MRSMTMRFKIDFSLNYEICFKFATCIQHFLLKITTCSFNFLLFEKMHSITSLLINIINNSSFEFFFFFKVKHQSYTSYKRIRELISVKERNLYVFCNEHHR